MSSHPLNYSYKSYNIALTLRFAVWFTIFLHL